MSGAMRRATEADRAALLDYLEPRAPTSMFLLSNLADYGFDRAHRNAMRYWIAEEGSAVTGVVGLTEAGTLMPQLPPDLIEAAAKAVDGETIGLLLGPTEQVTPLRAAIGLAGAKTQMVDDEPQLVLDMADLKIPDTPGHLQKLETAPRDMLIEWRVGYEIEALKTDPAKAEEIGTRDIDNWIERDSHRVLIVDGAPVSMTGFNSMLPDIVQVGGVWTPHALRRRGYASRAVALHLEEMRKSGVGRATLFAASEDAARVYMNLGFRLIGRYTICLFAEPERADV
ncbi:GNAT family N-acetyltransferase [Flavimaricola marinus]|uniref:N-acetyltransferase domain-containing protein n=1 Tax=Flavimaricola marinus TaxID=1819565 RepID=A0A238LAX3_9RHOB|nr:GNAT family N-acetyltransferase [Flavimaricola marinus]SMY06829.1 hypothetical protein LOM8899_00959 [Flavimaricola marinus]